MPAVRRATVAVDTDTLTDITNRTLTIDSGGADRLGVVCMVGRFNSPGRTITALTFGGTDVLAEGTLEYAQAWNDPAGQVIQMSVYSLANPPTGASVSVSCTIDTSASHWALVCHTLEDSAANLGPEVFTTLDAAASPVNDTIDPSSTDNLGLDFFGQTGGGTGPLVTQGGSGQTDRASASINAGQLAYATSTTEPATDPLTMGWSWTTGVQDHSHVVFEVLPAPAETTFGTVLESATTDIANDALLANLDAGPAAGAIELTTTPGDYVGPELLVQVTLADPAFGASSGGTASMAGTPRTGTSLAAGTHAEFRGVDSTGAEAFRAAAADLVGSPIAQANETVRITGFDVLFPTGP